MFVVRAPIILTVVLLLPFQVDATEWPQNQELSPENEDAPQRYRTREERREAGSSYELGGGIRLSGLAELTQETVRYRSVEAPSRRETPREELSLEAVLEYAPDDSVISAEAVWEFDSVAEKVRLDEATLAFDFEPIEIELGRYYVSFGEYFSSFVSGPLVEFAETRGKVLQLNYSPLETLEISPFVYQGNSRRDRDCKKRLSWGLALEWLLNDSFIFGASYLSNLADSDEELLADDGGNVWSQQVPAISAYLLMGLGEIELSTEVVAATAAFPELETSQDRPFAWNTEIGLPLNEWLALNLRYEISDELEDAPERRYGLAMSIFLPRTFLTVEYLQADYAPGQVEDEQDNELKSSATVAVQISFTF